MFRNTCAVLATAALSIFAQACSGGHNNATKTDGGAAHEGGTSSRDYAPTMTGVYNEILKSRCGIPFCHLGAAGAPMTLDSQDDSYQQMVNVPANGPFCGDAGMAGLLRVDPGHPETSLLYLKIEMPSPPDLCGDPMPSSGAPLTDKDIQQIHDWIQQGAQND
jgi:hypothetical protein